MIHLSGRIGLRKIFPIYFLLLMLFFTASLIAQERLSQSQKLYATAKVWGFLKYYHPNVADGQFNWDEQLFRTLRGISDIEDKKDLSDFFKGWIESLGKIEKCSKCDNRNDPNTFTKNFDLEWIGDTTYFEVPTSKLLRHVEANRAIGRQAFVHKVGKAGQVEPRNEPLYETFEWSNMDLRMLSLFRYWNFVEYFYPYKYLTDQDWDTVLKEMISKFLSVDSELDYHLVLLELIVKLDDSHAGLRTPLLDDFFGTKYIPVIHRYIEDRIVITDYFNDSLAKANDLRIGDVILSADGTPVDVLIEERSKYLQGGNKGAKIAYAWDKIFNGNTDSLRIDVLRNGLILEKRIARFHFDDFHYQRPNNQGWRFIENTILYLDMGALTIRDLSDFQDSLPGIEGIIFDLRNYPKDFFFEELDFIFDEGMVEFFKSIVPDLSYPGKFLWKDGDTFKKKTRIEYNGKNVILVNQRTISLAEFTAMYLQCAKNTVTIGGRTLAADGNVTRLELLGGLKTGLTGIGIFYPDGRGTQRTGIAIDIEVEPTIEGIRNGKDEILQRAIQIIKR